MLGILNLGTKPSIYYIQNWKWYQDNDLNKLQTERKWGVGIHIQEILCALLTACSIFDTSKQ